MIISITFVSCSNQENPSTAIPPPSKIEVTAEKPVIFEDGMYSLSIPSSIGLLTYYNQTDVRWADSIYGGNDPISTYGCGPTVLSMLVSSFTNQSMTPDAMAVWAKENHYWASGSGSAHALIPEGVTHFGFSVESFSDYSEQGIIHSLQNNYIFVALMGPGHFTSNGHFIILADDWSGSSIRIADPNSLENTQTPWEASLILNELDHSAQAGGPLWRISVK